jgi:hypothetical protein
LDLPDWIRKYFRGRTSREEIEKELRAQIELALFHLPHCSRATPHMDFNTISPQVNDLAFRLIREYNIDANIKLIPFKDVSLFGDVVTKALSSDKLKEVIKRRDIKLIGYKDLNFWY